MRPVMTFKPVYGSNGRQAGVIENGKAMFHAWGVEYEEFENGPGNYTVAIVENPDGSVETFMPHLIVFLDNKEERDAG